MQSIGTGWLWIVFFILVFTLLTVDLVFFGGKKSHKVTGREALRWTFIWVASAFIFNIFLWIYLKHTYGSVIAAQKSLEFFTGYIIEESLSFDNMFVILMIFQFFMVPIAYQRRVLLYGVLGAMAMRLIMILVGVWLIHQFHWVLYLFGLFILFTGVKMLLFAENKKSLADNPLVIWLQRHLRLTPEFHEEQFFVKINKLYYVTPLFLVLILVEIGDLIFALDSIPAIFAITTDPFIVFTSNIFAILGLRAIYFLLASMADKFYLLKYGIALVLIFIGFKMILEPWIKISIILSLSIVMSILVTTIILSLLRRKK